MVLARTLQVDKSLAWRVLRFVRDPDHLSGARHLPGDAGLHIIVRAFRARNAPSATCNALEAAIAELDRVVRVHAGSRSAFRALLAHAAPATDGREGASDFRRMGFYANAALWGVETATRSSIVFLTPGAQPGSVDAAVASGFVGLRRIRRDLAWPLMQQRPMSVNGSRCAGRPLEPGARNDQPPLLKGHSTINAAHLRHVPAPDGAWCELLEGNIGSSAAIDCFFGERFDGAHARPNGVKHAPPEALLRLDIPARNAVVDLYVDRALPHRPPMQAALYSLLTGGDGTPEQRHARDRLPCPDPVRTLTRDSDEGATALIPQYAALVRECLGWMGRERAHFDHYRVEVKFPLIPTALALSVALDEA